jgi:hypothetical protein
MKPAAAQPARITCDADGGPRSPLRRRLPPRVGALGAGAARVPGRQRPARRAGQGRATSRHARNRLRPGPQLPRHLGGLARRRSACRHGCTWSIEEPTRPARGPAARPRASAAAALAAQLLAPGRRSRRACTCWTSKAAAAPAAGLGDVAALLPELRLQADAFYLDGFAPDRNPAMWDGRVFKALARLAAPGCTAATWSVARPIAGPCARARQGGRRRASRADHRRRPGRRQRRRGARTAWLALHRARPPCPARRRGLGQPRRAVPWHRACERWRARPLHARGRLARRTAPCRGDRQRQGRWAMRRAASPAAVRRSARTAARLPSSRGPDGPPGAHRTAAGRAGVALPGRRLAVAGGSDGSLPRPPRDPCGRPSRVPSLPSSSSWPARAGASRTNSWAWPMASLV